MGRRHEQTFPQRGPTHDQRHRRKCSTSLSIGEIQIKTTMRSHLTAVRMAKMNRSGNDRCWGGCGEGEPLTLLVGTYAGTATLDNGVEGPPEVEHRASLRPSSCTRDLPQRYRCSDPKGHLQPNVHNSQTMERAQMARTDEWIEEVIHTHTHTHTLECYSGIKKKKKKKKCCHLQQCGWN